MKENSKTEISMVKESMIGPIANLDTEANLEGARFTDLEYFITTMEFMKESSGMA